MRFLLLAVSLCGLAVVACGGKAVVDDDGAGGDAGSGPGSGASAQGGSTSTSPTSASGVPSTSATGPTPVCDCLTACEKLVDCGVEVPTSCGEICEHDEIPAEIEQCLCSITNCDFDQCIGSSSSGPGSSSGGTGGGAPNGDCVDCIDSQAQDRCEAWVNACGNNPECTDLFDCHSDCRWTPECNRECDSVFQGGLEDFYNVVSCVACGECFGPCSSSALVDYCPIKE